MWWRQVRHAAVERATPSEWHTEPPARGCWQAVQQTVWADLCDDGDAWERGEAVAQQGQTMSCRGCLILVLLLLSHR